MATINTNDWYIQDYCKNHPEAETMLQELVALKNDWFGKYGIPKKGGVESCAFDINAKEWFRKVKAVQIDLLKELKRVCDENGLKLFLVYGSLLGAVRSGGMLDGDDDIDVALLREDYDKLVQLSGSFKSPYFLQNNYNDDCFYGGYIKLRNAQTTAIIPQNWYVNCCEGIFLDIFPIDKGFGSKRKERLKLKKIHHLQRLLYAKSYGFFRNFKDMPLFVWKFYKYAGKLFPREKLLRKLDAACRAGDSDCKNFGIYTHYGIAPSARYIPALSYKETCTMSYEGMEILAPKNWDDVLCKFYGYGYLTPSNSRAEFHAFYKADVSYEKYKARFTRLFTSAPDTSKKIVLMGDEELFTEYKKRFPSSAYKPESLLKLEETDRLKEYDLETTHIVIAAFDFLAVENTVRERGFRDYSIYVYNREWMCLPDLKNARINYKIEKGKKDAEFQKI